MEDLEKQTLKKPLRWKDGIFDLKDYISKLELEIEKAKNNSKERKC